MSGGRWSAMVTHHLTNAARDGDVKAMDELLEKYPWVLEHDDVVFKAMETSLVRDHTEFFFALLDRGIPVDHENEDNGETCMHVAARANKGDTMKELVRRGAEVNKQDIRGNTPLHYAVDRGHCTGTDVLVDLCADAGIKNKQGHSPLDIARAKRYIGLERGMITRIAKRHECRLKRRYIQNRPRP